MKKTILIIDIIFIIITFLLAVHFNYSNITGLAALEDVGNFVKCLIILVVEILLLVYIGVSWMKQHKRK